MYAHRWTSARTCTGPLLDLNTVYITKLRGESTTAVIRYRYRVDRSLHRHGTITIATLVQPQPLVNGGGAVFIFGLLVSFFFFLHTLIG